MNNRSSWYVCRTNPNCEPRAIASLQRAGFGPYAPQFSVEKRHHRTGAWITKQHNLMPGYLFVEAHGTPDWFSFRKCDGVKGVLGVYNGMGELEPFPVPSRLVEKIMAAQLNMVFDQTRAAKERRGEDAKSVYQPGVSICITAGPFAGHIGEVESVRANGTISALTSLFGRMTPMELDPAQVELVAA